MKCTHWQMSLENFNLVVCPTLIYTAWPSWQTPFEDLERIYRRAGHDNVSRFHLTKGMSLGFLGLRATPTFSDTFFQSYGESIRMHDTFPF